MEGRIIWKILFLRTLSGFHKFAKTKLSLSYLMERNGFFVDLAASDATVLSNTYSLERKFGWTGLCIEPNPIYWANHSYRDCQLVAAVVGKERMAEVRFRFNDEVLGGIAADGFDSGEQGKEQSDRKYTVTLKEILQRFNAPKHIDYLSLDGEGAESYVLYQFPFTDYRASLMTIERPTDHLKALLGRNGYKVLKLLSSWGETLWAHESMIDSLDLLSLAEFTSTQSPTPNPTQPPTSNPAGGHTNYGN
ncbi:methyltransferase [Fragilaria crotonensis]|nr:methyltransferase [Fragilaria crotonensis]